MVNYQDGKIYKLTNDVDDKIYVGSTCRSLNDRKIGHKSDSKKRPDSRVYKHIIPIGWDKIKIVLIENFECKSKEELLKRERYWIEKLDAELNKDIPSRTMKEYRKYYNEKYSEQVKEYARKWREENKEYMKNYDKKRYYKNIDKEIQRSKDYIERVKDLVECDCGGSYNRGQPSRIKLHFATIKHKKYMGEKIDENYINKSNQKNKEYREKAKDIVKCDCGGSYDKGNLSKTKRHFATIKHKKYLDTLKI